MRHSVLDDESLDSIRMGQGHAKTHGAAVILHVKRVAREPKSLGEVIHGFGDVIERVREFLRVRPVTVSEARIIGRDKVIVIGKLGEEGLEHPRGRRESVQQEKRWRVFRPGLSVKDGESIYLYRAIKSRVFHGTFLSLGVGGWNALQFGGQGLARTGAEPRGAPSSTGPAGGAPDGQSHAALLLQ